MENRAGLLISQQSPVCSKSHTDQKMVPKIKSYFIFTASFRNHFSIQDRQEQSSERHTGHCILTHSWYADPKICLYNLLCRGSSDQAKDERGYPEPSGAASLGCSMSSTAIAPLLLWANSNKLAQLHLFHEPWLCFHLDTKKNRKIRQHQSVCKQI